MTWRLRCFIAFAALGCLFALALDAGFFEKTSAAYLADYPFLLNLPGKTPDEALKTLSFSKSDFGH